MKKTTWVVAIGLFLLFIFLIPGHASTAAPTITYYFNRSWGSEADQFLNPQSVTWGKDNIILVANTKLHRITAISTRNNTYNTWGHIGFGPYPEFQNTYGVVVDSDGYVYCSDGNGYITKTTASGQLINTWSMPGAYTMAISPQGHLYIVKRYLSDADDRYIHQYTLDGQFVASWGEHGTGIGYLQKPQAIAFDTQGYVYIADTSNNRIQKFTAEGGYITAWGSGGDGNGQFLEPQGIAVSNTGHVYVADTLNNRIQVFTSTGTYTNGWGAYGNQPGQLKAPKGLAVNESGVLIVADSNNNRIQMFGADGTYLGQFGGAKSYSMPYYFSGAVAVNANHQIFIADNQTYRVQHFNENMELVKLWDSYQNYLIRGIATDPAGYLYTIGDSCIKKFDLNGQLLGENCSYGSPWAIAVDSSSNIYAGWHEIIRKFDANFSFLTSWSFPNGSLAGVTVDGNNYVYVTDPNSREISQYDNNGTFRQTMGNFNGPTGLAAYQNMVFVADQFGYHVEVYNSLGEKITSWGSLGNGAGEFVWPQYIATYKAQDVYVVDGSGLQKFSTSTTPGFQNGSFENHWPLFSWSFGGVLDVQRGDVATDGVYSLQIGTPVNQEIQGEGFGWANQTIYVDPSTEYPVLHFDYRIFTNDIIDYSDFVVHIQDGTGRNHLATVLRAGYPSGGYAPPAGTDLGWRSAGFDLSPYKGQHIRLVFSCRNLWPDSLGIWTYVDDVRVVDATYPFPRTVFLPMTIRR